MRKQMQQKSGGRKVVEKDDVKTAKKSSKKSATKPKGKDNVS